MEKEGSKGHDLDTTEDLENSILDALRLNMGITARAYEEHRKNHGKKVTAVQRGADEEDELDLVSDSDDE